MKKQIKITDEIDEYPVVVIKWTDARTTANGWTAFEDVNEGLPIAYTAGFLLDETADSYVVGETFAEDLDVLNVMVVPKGVVLGIQYLANEN
jgi:hypothetical protein